MSRIVSKNLLGFTAILKWKPKRHEGGGGVGDMSCGDKCANNVLEDFA